MIEKNEFVYYLEFQGFFSLRSTIITSAFITVVLFGFQLFIGMQNYKKHKLQLFKGIYEDINGNGDKIRGSVKGFFGEIDPEVITNFELEYPVIAFEMEFND